MNKCSRLSVTHSQQMYMRLTQSQQGRSHKNLMRRILYSWIVVLSKARSSAFSYEFSSPVSFAPSLGLSPSRRRSLTLISAIPSRFSPQFPLFVSAFSAPNPTPHILSYGEACLSSACHYLVFSIQAVPQPIPYSPSPTTSPSTSPPYSG